MKEEAQARNIPIMTAWFTKDEIPGSKFTSTEKQSYGFDINLNNIAYFQMASNDAKKTGHNQTKERRCNINTKFNSINERPWSGLYEHLYGIDIK